MTITCLEVQPEKKKTAPEPTIKPDMKIRQTSQRRILASCNSSLRYSNGFFNVRICVSKGWLKNQWKRNHLREFQEHLPSSFKKVASEGLVRDPILQISYHLDGGCYRVLKQNAIRQNKKRPWMVGPSKNTNQQWYVSLRLKQQQHMFHIHMVQNSV